MNYRTLRVAGLIQEELGALIIREVEFENALVTITEVEVSKKLDSARVKVSVIPSSAGEAALKTLRKSRGDLQHKLLKKLNIYPMPQIKFELDHRPAHAATVEKILLEDNNSDTAA